MEAKESQEEKERLFGERERSHDEREMALAQKEKLLAKTRGRGLKKKALMRSGKALAKRMSGKNFGFFKQWPQTSRRLSFGCLHGRKVRGRRIRKDPETPFRHLFRHRLWPQSRNLGSNAAIQDADGLSLKPSGL
jgi:hypothetical protein